MVRARFAPSPTGLLHVGNVRIALLNYLFAKKNSGRFVLRIDDTDLERSSKELEKLMLEDLEWLGIRWDEFYRQTDRFNDYASAFDYLRNIGRIYPCFETKEELALARKIQSSQGRPPVYNRAALKLTSEQIKTHEENGKKAYWRFKLSDEGAAEWNDLVHGKISIQLNSISDPVVVKPDGSYVYTFASVVDDINMGISHVIRGDDHITNTAVQIDLFRAICGNIPDFGHLPLLSSFDGQDISKRTGSDLSVVNMRNAGLYPRAIVAVLTAIGTSENINYMDSMDAMIEKFSFEKMSKSSPKFNIEDVKSLTKKILSEKSFEEAKKDMDGLNLKNVSKDFWEAVRGNINSMNELSLWDEIFFGEISVIKEDETFVLQMLETLADPVDFETWISCLKNFSGRKGRDLFHPLRIVLTGLDKGPELKKIVELLGYDRIKKRIENNIKTAVH